MKFKRIFLIVLDSVGIGNANDADKYNDLGANTLKHISEVCNGINIPNLESLGLGDLDDIIGVDSINHPRSYSLRLNEQSNGKDTMTGHWEMMGVETIRPFLTFTDFGFPKELIEELEKRSGYKFIGNKAASGTEIIDELGEQQIKDKSLIIYTSSDSVLQIAAHEKYIGLNELYKVCEIARDICLDPKYMVARVIARPFIGEKKGEFKRTSNRHDYAIEPPQETVLNILKDRGLETSCIGKIGDIFVMSGVSKIQKTTSNFDGMNKTIDEAKNNDFKGLCFVNLVEFDSEYGHRRNSIGYKKCLEDFDKQLGDLLKVLRKDDLLLITADHGNDPTYKGTDHTREKVPLLAYSLSFDKGKLLEDRNSFGDIGCTILKNFDLNKPDNICGDVIKELLK